MTTNQHTIVYLMGHGFSGSTLLTMLLNAHPEIATVGEMGISPQSDPDPTLFRCSCQSLVRDCPFWQRVSIEMERRGHPFDIRRNDLLFRYSDDLPDRLMAAYTRGPAAEALRATLLSVYPPAHRYRAAFLARNEAFIRLVLALKGASVFLDSTKRPERALHLRHLPGFRMKVIDLVRDGRAVANSCIRNLGVSAEQGAQSWLRDCQATANTKRYFDRQHWMTLRYEDLCADLSGSLDRVFEFIGIDRIDVSHYRTCEHHVIGNRMRLMSTSEVRLDERWRHELASDQRAHVSRLVSEMNARYGYAAG